MRVFLTGRGIFKGTLKWEGGLGMYNFVSLWASVILAEKLFNYFGSCLQDGLKRSKYPFIYSFLY